jgi:tRNA(His) guanylyltransferase
MDSIGDRMKGYEAVWDQALIRRTPAIIRVDGKAFHSFTRHMDRPFDAGLRGCMEAVALALCEGAQGAKMAYLQSDEVSVLLTDFDTLQTEPWFGNRVQKMASIASATATVAFAQAYRSLFGEDGMPLFDARVFAMPREEVANYFVWRQQDATRNSIQMAARAVFSHKQCHGKNQNDLQEMLWGEGGINWNDYPTAFKRGACVVRRPEAMVIPAGPREGDTIDRMRWVVDREPPIFTQDRDYVECVFGATKAEAKAEGAAP